MVNTHIYVLRQELALSLDDAFHDVDAVHVHQGSILGRKADAIVSAANSFGFMDGGLDLLYSEHFGWDVEKAVRSAILEDHDGELPVGQALIVPISDHPDVRWMICAPTMRVPMDVSRTAHAYLAFRAVLRCVRTHNQSAAPEDAIETLLCPALATGEGRMSGENCAAQMRRAWDRIVNRDLLRKGGLAEAVRDHLELIGED